MLSILSAFFLFPYSLLCFCIKLWGSLQKVIKVAELDLVVLNKANPILRFEAISDQSLFCRDPGRRAEFASLTAREYGDSMALWQRGLKYRQEFQNR